MIAEEMWTMRRNQPNFTEVAVKCPRTTGLRPTLGVVRPYVFRCGQAYVANFLQENYYYSTTTYSNATKEEN
jgi:hypothetical protein